MDHTLVVKAPVGNNAQRDYGTFRQMLLNQAQVKGVFSFWHRTGPGIKADGIDDRH